jgi:hypothetical protein
MRLLLLSLGLLGFPQLAACAPPAQPTQAQITIIQPGIEAEQRGDYGFAFFTYRYWALMHVALAQYRLGRLYEHGLGTNQDDAEAAKWYRAASETGYPTAHAALGRLYQQGRGVPQDDAVAFALYQKGAAAGSTRRAPQLAMPRPSTSLASFWSRATARRSIGATRQRTIRLPRTRATSRHSWHSLRATEPIAAPRRT